MLAKVICSARGGAAISKSRCSYLDGLAEIGVVLVHTRKFDRLRCRFYQPHGRCSCVDSFGMAASEPTRKKNVARWLLASLGFVAIDGVAWRL